MYASPRVQLAVEKYVSPHQLLPSVLEQHHMPLEMWLSRWM